MFDRNTVLIVGGTGFLGSELVRAAVDADCAVTVLTRGERQAELPEGVERLVADRNGDLSVLADRRFDRVIDGCAYTVDQVDRLLDALGDRFAHYTFISSVSACDLSTSPVLESAPGVTAKDPDNPDYGEAKAQCERRVTERLGERAAIVRPGLIGGPGDHTGRATHWAMRADRGGLALAPGSPKDVLQLIDVRDLAPFTVGLALDRASGVFHAVGHETTWGAFLDHLGEATGDRVRWYWVGVDVLEAHGIQAWTDLPAWVPAVGEFAGVAHVDRTRADEHGLFTRAPASTALDAWRWQQANPEQAKSPGLSAEREAKVLPS